MSEEKKLNHEPVESAGCDSGAGNQQEKDFKIHLSHDGLFTVFFDKKNVVESFTRENLPAEITRDLDFSTLALSKDKFVDLRLARCYSDVLYHIQFKNSPAYLYFLFEHKSWEPDFPGVQVLKNMTHIWEKHVEQYKGTKKLPPIIPLLIYHGKYPWKVDTSFISMFDIPETLSKYIPSFKYELTDVSHMPEEEIKGDIELRIVLTTFRYIFQPEILSRLKNIFQLFRELPDKIKFNQYLELLLRYLGSNIRDVNPDQLRDSVTEVLEEGGAMMSTVFQQILERGKEIGVKEGEERGKEIGVKEGEERGIKEGEERGKEIGVKEGEERGIKEGKDGEKLRVAMICLIKGMDIQTIAEITDLPVERIELLKKAVRDENTAQR
jgi:predicted transposase/invertase (TIGR01784 family)